jgi:hypothetical protein
MRHQLCAIFAVLLLVQAVNAQKSGFKTDIYELVTPYEGSGKKRTATYTECVDWYRGLQKQFPNVCKLDSIGLSDGGSLPPATLKSSC